MKKVSIIIPLYNNEKYIKECIESIINQSYANIEIVIIDDGSTDNSYKICEDFKDSRIKLIKQINFGAPLARNEGIKQSTGEYIMFLDSDDCLYSKDTIKRILDNFDEKKYDLYIGGVQEITYDGRFIKLKKVLKSEIKDDYEQTFLCDPIPAGKLFKRSIIEKNNIYFDNIRIGQDLNFYLKYICFCKNIKKSDDIVASYRIVDSSISRTYGIKILDISESLKKIENFYRVNNFYEDNKNMLNVIRLIHLYNQFVKYVFIKEKHIRKIIKYYFESEIKKIKLDYKNYSKDMVNYIKYIKIKFYLKRNIFYFYKMRFRRS